MINRKKNISLIVPILYLLFSPLNVPVYADVNDSTIVLNRLEAISSEPETILAKVGDKYITTREFYERSEYTIRPKWVKGNTNVHKKIILNSLIAEKLIALERGKQSPILQSKKFQRVIEGRKEQLMRQVLFDREGYDKVELDSVEFIKEYKLAGRTYHLEFINVSEEHEAEFIKRQLDSDTVSFLQAHYELTGDSTIATKDIPYHNPEFEEINEVLFGGDSIKDGQIIGPVALKDSYLFLHVKGWTNKIAMTNEDELMRYNNVKDKLTTEQAVSKYADFIRQVMKGKKMDFDRDIFFKLVGIIAPYYLKTNREVKDQFLGKTFEEYDDGVAVDLGDISVIRDKALFTIDGEIWTVGMLEEELDRHPLVFRANKINEENFAEQFKYAVVDLIRNKHLTDVAYKRGLDKEFIVQRYTNMWSDALISLYEQEVFLNEKKINDLTSYVSVKNNMEPFIDSLQEKYSDIIEVNVEEFDKIRLTRIDMFAVQKNVPFPIIVPAFPNLTTDHHLDYGKKMEINYN